MLLPALPVLLVLFSIKVPVPVLVTVFAPVESTPPNFKVLVAPATAIPELLASVIAPFHTVPTDGLTSFIAPALALFPLPFNVSIPVLE